MNKIYKIEDILKERKVGSDFNCGDLRRILKNESILDTDTFDTDIDDDDDIYFLNIYRTRLETDEEYGDRVNEAKRVKDIYNRITEKDRYEKYLELKKEFEGREM